LGTSSGGGVTLKRAQKRAQKHDPQAHSSGTHNHRHEITCPGAETCNLALSLLLRILSRDTPSGAPRGAPLSCVSVMVRVPSCARWSDIVCCSTLPCRVSQISRVAYQVSCYGPAMVSFRVPSHLLATDYIVDFDEQVNTCQGRHWLGIGAGPWPQGAAS